MLCSQNEFLFAFFRDMTLKVLAKIFLQRPTSYLPRPCACWIHIFYLFVELIGTFIYLFFTEIYRRKVITFNKWRIKSIIGSRYTETSQSKHETATEIKPYQGHNSSGQEKGIMCFQQYLRSGYGVRIKEKRPVGSSYS